MLHAEAFNKDEAKQLHAMRPTSRITRRTITLHTSNSESNRSSAYTV